MDSFEINKIVASILLIVLLFIGIGKISDLVFHVDKPETAGYKVELPEDSGAKQIAEKTNTSPEEVDIKEVETENQIILELKVSKDDFGKVIGKSGRNISAIRTILFAINAKKGGKKVVKKYSKFRNIRNRLLRKWRPSPLHKLRRSLVRAVPEATSCDDLQFGQS